ncbi:MAG: hypothetical protein J3R72DRAFT_59121 [Linnemannia gamsii]|nr:MAG: hypothetical protein J3R72DRAFT_59121 [Linnemannia gamsii]
MAKKMERLEASTEFRPFKFRIQAFTNAFHDSLIMHGLTEDVLPLRKVKLYLWKHRYISRFNEDGKKQKSKGNHVWNIEARKISNVVAMSEARADGTVANMTCSIDGAGVEAESMTVTPTSTAAPTSPSTASTLSSSSPSATSSTMTTTTTTTGFYDLLPPDMDLKQIGPEAISAAGGGLGIIRRPSSPVRWEFREYSSRIAGHIIKYARVGVPYVYSPRIWDAQMSCPAAKFSSPWLPDWLKWHRGELKGIPTSGDESCTIVVVAEYVREGEECRLEMSFPLTVCDPAKDEQEYQLSGASSAFTNDGSGLGGERNGIDGAGAVGASSISREAAFETTTSTTMRMQTNQSPSTTATTLTSSGQYRLGQQQQQQQQVAIGVEDEEMMAAMKEDEEMEDREQDSSLTHTNAQSIQHNSYFSNSHHQEQQLHHHNSQTSTSPRQQDHQREQRQAQQRFQRLQLQEHHQHVPQDQRDSLSQPTTRAPSSVGASAGFFMNPPSSRGSISSNGSGSSAYVDEEEFSDDGDEDDEDDEGMESMADGEEDNARRKKTKSTRNTSSSSSTATSAARRKASRDRRSMVLAQDNKRRKHD